jgi:hypothetical protein
LVLFDSSRGEFFSALKTHVASTFTSAEFIIEGLVEHNQRLVSMFSPVRFEECRVNGRPLAEWRYEKVELLGSDRFFVTSTSPIGKSGASFSVARQ